MKIDFFLAEPEPFAAEQLLRRRAVDIGGGAAASFYSPDDLIIRKLSWFRLGREQSERQWRDLVGMLTVMKERLDVDYLRLTAEERGVTDLLGRALAKAAQ